MTDYHIDISRLDSMMGFRNARQPARLVVRPPAPAARDDVPAEMSTADAPAKRADGPVDRPGVPRSALEERRSRSETRVLHSAPFSLRHRASP